jgi:sec-independent protein translocase protein TatB
MFDIGFSELVVLAVIAMVVVGPERLPGVVRTVGKTMGQARRFMTGLQNQIEQEIKLDELNKKIMAETKDMDFTAKNQPHSHQNEDAEVPSIAPTSNDLPEPPAAPQASDNTVEKSNDTDRS